MTVSLEKIFFGYVISNRRYFEIVLPAFFKNIEIQFVYGIIRKYMISNSGTELPTPKQILEMVLLEDHDNLISKDILKMMLSVDLSQYDEKAFIVPKLHAWVLSNRVKAGTVSVIEETRGLDSISDYSLVSGAVDRIKDIVQDMSNTNFIQDDDIGSDFDDPENHVQDSSRFKIKSGFNTLDHILGGGWDISTLNCIMAETNNGKSLWMQNFAYKSADMGYNVLYVTLEMSERKVMKRIGSMRLEIPINEYDSISKDTEFIKKKIEGLKHKASAGINADIFENKVGKIFTKFWAAGTVTVSDIDNYVTKLEDKKNIKIQLIIVDYISLISSNKGTIDSLYTKGKSLAEGLRALGAKHKCPVITGVQVAKDAWNSTDITLESVPESKAIAETADSFFAIIRNEEMKRQGIYRFKLLKQRDGDFLKSQIRLNLNNTFLTLENDVFLDSV